jgi:hypothetical protein
MSAGSQVDYDALAKKYGATSSQPAGVDYAALAKQYGATSSADPEPTFWQKVKQAFSPRDPMSMPGATRPTGAMPGSFEGHPENVGQYIPASAGEIAGGAKDIAQGNIAHGAHRAFQGAGQATIPALPFLAPLIAANPGAVALAGAGGAAGQFGAKKGAEALGATPDQADLAGDVGGLAGGYGGAKLPGFLSKLNPGALKTSASAAFNTASEAAGSSPVDVEGPGQVALDALDKAAVGRKMPVTMRKFIQRVAAPDAEPLSYDEAREFYQAAGEMSANERNGLTPSMQRLLNGYRKQLGQSIQQTADVSGVGSEYASAMSDYAKAKRLEDAWQLVWGAAKKNFIPGLMKGLGIGAGGTAIYGAYKSFSK